MSVIRTMFVLTVFVIATIVGIPAQWISLKLGLPTRRWIPCLYHRMCLWLLDVRVEVRGAIAIERPLLLVVNHSSWLDHLILSSRLPLMFIAKSEIAGWPVFGLLAKLQRSVFVDRARRQSTGDVNREIASRLTSGDPVVLYGEGTTGDGNFVLPFRSALLGAMRETMGEGECGYLQPVSIAYTHLQGLPMGRQHRPVAAWHGNVDLLKHIARVLRIGAIDAVVTLGAPVAVKPNMDRKLIAKDLERSVKRMTTAARLGRKEIASFTNDLVAKAGPVPLAGETR
jgi:lyso-ornithine lipid O-acyltransferase